MQKLIILRGYPGVGKTTVGKKLQEAGLGRFIDHNEILTFIARITKDDDGIYDDIHNLEIAMMRKLLQDGESVIIARGFSTSETITPYIEIGKAFKQPIHIFRLNAPVTVLAERVQASQRKDDFNPILEGVSLQKWIDGNELEALDREIVINAEPPIQEVVKNIRSYLKL